MKTEPRKLLIAIPVVWVLATGWAVQRQRARVDCYYDATSVAQWDQCDGLNSAERFIRAAYDPFIDL